jgi:D-arginine dehydrogenase
VEARDVVVIGGGIAGLATALPLARAGRRTLLVEAEAVLASHSSGRNAAIWLAAHDDPTTPELARRSRELLDAEWPRDAAPWLAPVGALVAAETPAALASWERGAERCGMQARRADAAEAVRRAPALAGGAARTALWLPEAGVIDVHAATETLARVTRRAGGEIRTGRRVARVAARGGRVEGVELDDGARVAADAVVLAAGAWSAGLGESCGAPLPLAPLRRHLVVLEPAEPALASGAIVWWASDDVYWRPESGGVLASPCDEEPFAACSPPADDAALEGLLRKLRRAAPALAASRVRRSWACLRTFAPDRELVAGADPRIVGLFWLAGLGGRGMTIGAAAGELAAGAVFGKRSALAERTAPARLLARCET